MIARAAKLWPNHPAVSSRDAERLERTRRPGPSQSSPPTCTRRRLHPLTDWTSTDVAPPATVSMNCEQFAQATDTSPLSLREREPSKSLGSLLLGTNLSNSAYRGSDEMTAPPSAERASHLIGIAATVGTVSAYAQRDPACSESGFSELGALS